MPDHDLPNLSVKNKTLYQFASGSLAGLAETVLNHPLSTIKNIIQARPKEHPVFKAIDQFKQKRYRNSLNYIPQATRSLYSGLGLATKTLVPIYALQIGLGKQMMQRLNYSEHNNRLIAASSSGFVSSIFFSPIELGILTQQIKPALNTSLSTYRYLTSNYGYQVLSLGFWPTAAKGTLFTLTYMGLFPIINNEIKKNPNSQQSLAVPANLALGIFSSLMTQPIDFIKTKIQSRPQTRYGFFKLGKEVYKASGIKGFYRGGIPRTIRGCSALFVINFVQQQLDTMVNYLENRNAPERKEPPESSNEATPDPYIGTGVSH